MAKRQNVVRRNEIFYHRHTNPPYLLPQQGLVRATYETSRSQVINAISAIAMKCVGTESIDYFRKMITTLDKTEVTKSPWSVFIM